MTGIAPSRWVQRGSIRMDRYSTGSAAKVIGVSDSTIRGWARIFAGFLSPGANPVKGQYRVFTGSDLAVFEAIKGWRAADPLLSDEDIAGRLRQVPAADFRAGPAVEHGAAVEGAGVSGDPGASGSVEGDQLPALPVSGDPGGVLAAFVDRLGAVDQRLAALEVSSSGQRIAAAWWVAGVVVGGLLGILIGLVIAGAR